MGPVQDHGVCERQHWDSQAPGQGSLCYVHHTVFLLLNFCCHLLKNIPLGQDVSPSTLPALWKALRCPMLVGLHILH